MPLVQAEIASVTWDSRKKSWAVTITVGGEVIKRSAGRALPQDASDEALREFATGVAHEEGYEIRPDQIRIER